MLGPDVCDVVDPRGQKIKGQPKLSLSVIDLLSPIFLFSSLIKKKKGYRRGDKEVKPEPSSEKGTEYVEYYSQRRR